MKSAALPTSGANERQIASDSEWKVAMATRFVSHAKGARRVRAEKAELEQQVSALTGGLGYSNFQGMERAKQRARAEAAVATRECSMCFLENGEHEDWCSRQCEAEAEGRE